MADILLIFVGASEGGHGGPEALWLQDYQWVSVAMLILIAVAIYFGETSVTAKVVATVLFLMLTAPLAAHMLGRSAVDGKTLRR